MNAHVREIGHHSPIGHLNERPEPYGVRRTFQEQRFDSIFSVPRNHHRPNHHHRHQGYDYDQRQMVDPYYGGGPGKERPTFGQVVGGVLKGGFLGGIFGGGIGAIAGGIVGGLGKLFG